MKNIQHPTSNLEQPTAPRRAIQWMLDVSRLLGSVALVTFLPAFRLSAAAPPAPFGPVPSQRQLAWHDMEFYGFVHFTVNTFTDKEWGYGDEPESVFNPTDFSATQIVQTAKAAGMKGLILTCKHHDGFCLWPSKFTEHSVKNSPWKNGHGDVVREISDACRKAGLKFGIYLSPWDRNSAVYGQPEYLTYYRNQLRELLTNYGPIFEVWFDGANGGDGFYGGAREKRNIDRRTYYDWDHTRAIVRELMPGAMMFSDGGPDVRWVGNERGIAGDPCWATLNGKDFFPGEADEKRLNSGDRPGTGWLPAECDVSIRPGWFYHAKEDAQVKTPEQLLELYFASAGRGASFLLNLPPDRRGRIPNPDVQSLMEFRNRLDSIFSKNLAAGANVTASNVRGNDKTFAAKNVLAGSGKKYWSTDDGVTTPELILDLRQPTTFNIVSLREFLPLGQRIEAFALDQWQNGQWVPFAAGTSIGSHRLIRGDFVTTSQVRLRITQSPVCPALAEFGLFAEPSPKVASPAEAEHSWPKADPAAVAHWQALRFGMFIHWGPVSLTGHEIGWSRGAETPVDVYDNLYHQFNPTNFNADEWVSIAKAAGMKYIVLTTKHHDGFCLWDTKFTDYNIMHTPFHRDVVQELAAACKKQGIEFGAYYSVPDWYDTNWPVTSPAGSVKREKYDLDAYEKYLQGQITELIKNYGPLLTIWNDIPAPYGKRGADTIKLVRRLQPSILINNRTGDGGDYDTPEQQIGKFQMDRPWESCMTVSAHNQWAWGGAGDGVKSTATCLDMLIRGAGDDGNILLNVGPRPDGMIDPAQANVLKEIGAWLAKNGESIYGTRGGPWEPTPALASTRKGNRIYVHILTWGDGPVKLPNIPARIIGAQLINGGKAEVHQAESGVEISVAPANRDARDTVVVLHLDSAALKIPAIAIPSPTVPSPK